jgi:hypothetical protein
VIIDGLSVLDSIPVMVPVEVGSDQLYKVPSGTVPCIPLVGVTMKPTPLQVLVEIPTIFGLGLKFTTTEKAAPSPQMGVVGIT